MRVAERITVGAVKRGTFGRILLELNCRAARSTRSDVQETSYEQSGGGGGGGGSCHYFGDGS